MPVCHHCGQPMRCIRFGVSLTPRQAQVFDIIKVAPSSSRLLMERLGIRNYNTVKTHIFAINNKFKIAEIDYRINPVERQWRLVRLYDYRQSAEGRLDLSAAE